MGLLGNGPHHGAMRERKKKKTKKGRTPDNMKQYLVGEQVKVVPFMHGGINRGSRVRLA